MDLREHFKSLTDSLMDRALLLFGGLLALLSLVGILISIQLGLAMIVIFIAGVYFVNVLLLRLQQKKLNTIYRQIEALQALTNLISFRLPLPPTRQGAASPDVLVLLAREILTRKPLCLVECGAGVSTLVTGYLLEKLGQGQLITLEHDLAWANRVTRWVEEHGIGDRVKVVYAPLVSQIADGKTYQWYNADAYQSTLAILPPIDLLFVDGPPESGKTFARLPAVPILRPLLSPNCVIVMDDTERSTETQAARVWAEQLNYQLNFFTNLEKGAGVLQPKQ